MSFPEHDLASPEVTSHTNDKARPKLFTIDAEAKRIYLDFAKGEGTGAGFLQREEDTAVIQNLHDVQGVPQLQEWDDFMQGNQIASWVSAQGSPSNGAILQRLALFVLQEKGIV